MTPYLEHANLTVSNLDEAIRFLTTAVPEFTVRRRAVTDGQEWAHVGSQESYIALYQGQGAEPAEFTASNLNHLGIVVENARGVGRALREAGYQEGLQVAPHPHRTRIYFHDGDGNEWEFVEYHTTNPAQRNDYST